MRRDQLTQALDHAGAYPRGRRRGHRRGTLPVMTDSDLRPGVLRLVPTFVRRLWGGDTLPSALGVDAPPGREPVAEAWLASHDSVVDGGPWTGHRLADVIERWPAETIGRASHVAYGPILPLWVKFLDARDDLSIQVHPNDEQAAALHPDRHDLGKTESWRILTADAGAKITWGTRPTTPEEVRRAIDEGTLEDVVRHFPVRSGDVVHNPAGTVHAVHAGLTIYELQQASDLTYRLWDYGRRGADGRPRELHVDASLAVADLTGGGSPFVPYRDPCDGWTTWVTCDEYVMDEAVLDGSSMTPGDTQGREFHLLTVIEGEVVYAVVGDVGDGRGHEEMVLANGATLFVSAAVGRYALRGRGRVMRGRPNGGERPQVPG